MGSEFVRDRRDQRDTGRYNNRDGDERQGGADDAWRQPELEMVMELKDKARKTLAATKVEKDSTQTVRLWLNQITPDNYEKKQSELRTLLFGDRLHKTETGYEEQTDQIEIDEKKQLIVVQTIFRKAQTEHPYAGFYSDLCSQIVRLELLMKGMKPTKGNIKECSFRRHLLLYCKESFEALLQTPLTEEKKSDEKEEDRMEREFKTKHKLFGNIEFVGELFKLSIVTDMVMNQVFTSLLGIDVESDASVNDITIEAALRLVSKLGPTLDARIATESKPDKKEKLQEASDALFKRLKELETMAEDDTKNRASLRIKILIKNMFDNKLSGWAKTKDEKKIQTKDQVANAVLKQDMEKRKAENGGDRGDRRGDDRRDNRGGDDYNRDRRGGGDRKYEDRKPD